MAHAQAARPDASDLLPSDIRAIAGLADGITRECVEGYLRGARTQREKVLAIERALKGLGWSHLIRPRQLVKAGQR